MDLTGPEKAVLMLLSLEESAAAPIIAELDSAELHKLREVASVMREVPAASLDKMYEEFLQRSREAVAVPRGGVRYLRRVAARALGEDRTAEIFEGPDTAMDRLLSSDPIALAVVLENENPQLIAAVLSQLPKEKARDVLEQLPADLRPIVLERLARMTEVPAGLLEEVAAALLAEMPPSGAEAMISVDGLSKSASLVRHLDREAGETLLASLSQDDRDLADEIRRNMYSFEDLLILDKKSMRALLDSVSAGHLTLALKTASEALRERVFQSMSKRAADRLREDLELLGGVKLTEVEAAQQEILAQALALSAEGVLSFEENNGLV